MITPTQIPDYTYKTKVGFIKFMNFKQKQITMTKSSKKKNQINMLRKSWNLIEWSTKYERLTFTRNVSPLEVSTTS